MRVSNPEKQMYAIQLLKQRVPTMKIQDKLKKKFGSAMSNTDLRNLRNNWAHNKIPDMNEFNEFQVAFNHAYNFIFELGYVIETEGINQEKFHNMIQDANLKKYDELYQRSKVNSLLANMPKEITDNPKLLASVKLGLDQMRSGKVISFDELLKK